MIAPIFLSLILAAPLQAEDAVSFRDDVAPLLLRSCTACHGAKKAKGKYRLDSYEALMKEVVAGKPDESEFIARLVTDDEDDRMPQESEPLPTDQIALLRRWIAEGAKFDGKDTAALLTSIVSRKHPPAPDSYRFPLPITALAFSSDGTRLFLSGFNEVTEWEPTSGKLLHRYGGFGQRTYSLDLSPDGSKVAVGGGDPGRLGEIYLLGLDRKIPPVLIGRTSDVVLGVQFSPDGARLAAVSSDSSLMLFDIKSAELIYRIEPHADWATGVAWSPDGSKIATASRDRSGKVFDTKTGKPVSAFMEHHERVHAVVYAPDGNHVYTAGSDKKLRQWNPNDGTSKGEFPGMNTAFMGLARSGNQLFAANENGTVREYEATSRKHVRDYVAEGVRALSCAVSPRTNRLAAGYSNGTVAIWDIRDGKLLHKWLANP